VCLKSGTFRIAYGALLGSQPLLASVPVDSKKRGHSRRDYKGAQQRWVQGQLSIEVAVCVRCASENIEERSDENAGGSGHAVPKYWRPAHVRSIKVQRDRQLAPTL
jgi:hypothetical protein